MRQICSPRGIVDYNRPGQAVGDLKKAGFQSLVLDFEIVAAAGILEIFGTKKYKSDIYTAAIDDSKKLADMIKAYTDKVQSCGMNFPVAQAPFLMRDTKRLDLEDKLLELTIQCIVECGRLGCGKLIIRPWSENPTVFEALAKAALENNVTILLENQCKNVNGHLVRGLCSDEAVASAWIDELNKKYGDCFAFCMNVGTSNICGQNMYDFATVMGNRIQVVVIRDCDGNNETSLIPFSVANKSSCRTDWLNLIRGLRKIGFDGDLILDMADTAAVSSTLIRPALFNLAKSTIDYFAWQIGMELMLDKHSSRVLFGAGNMCRNYMKNYGEKYPPMYTCDNNSSLWGQTFEGLEIHNPEDLKALPDDTVIYICNIYYREIEAQLRDMGISNPIEYFNDEYMPTYNFDRIDAITRKSDKEDK